MAPHSSTLAWKAAVHGIPKSRTEQLHFPFSLSCIGEGNGNPLQCSCLENPRNRGAWWAAVYGVAQSQTRLKRLSSSSIVYNNHQLYQGLTFIQALVQVLCILFASSLSRTVFVSLKYHQEKERNLVLTFVTFLSNVLTKSYRFILKQIIILSPGQVSSQRRPEPSSLSNTLSSNVAKRSSYNWKVDKSSGSQNFYLRNPLYPQK